jgi:ABC-type Mn2+/Zn2+ transport system permease subunit
VPIVGVLLVFSFLVVPAAIAFQFTRSVPKLALLTWLAGALASGGGLWLSFHYDLPAGPVVVCAFGVLLLLAFGLKRVMGVNGVATA